MDQIMWLKFFFIPCLLSCGSVFSARILCFLPTKMKSHWVMFQPYLLELAERGHELTVISSFPQELPVKGIVDIDTNSKIEKIVSSMDITERKRRLESGLNGIEAYYVPTVFLMHIEKTCSLFEIPEVRKLVESQNDKFDLIITELFDSDVGLAFMHKFKAPNIAFSSCPVMPWANSRFANPDNPSYIPEMFRMYGSRMTFFQRTVNSLLVVYYKIVYYFCFSKKSQHFARKYFGDNVPDLRELAKNTSLMFVNTHYSLHGARPFVPGIIEVGGMHVKNSNKLNKDLQDYIDGAKHGVIYFCMGSMLKASTIPDSKRDALINAFKRLPQRVLWKWEDETMPGRPDNVKLLKWMPQRDVLAHPNVKLFISHGGLLGTTEAVHSGVPIIGIPFYGDQGVNIEAVASHGAGLRLDYDDITSESLYNTITEVLNNPKYTENAKSLSERFRDRPMSPLDTAVYWTEYVIRHKGAPHLRSAAVDLTWYQYLLLDVIAFILFVVVSVLALIYYSIKFIVKMCKPSKKGKSQKEKVKTS